MDNNEDNAVAEHKSEDSDRKTKTGSSNSEDPVEKSDHYEKSLSTGSSDKSKNSKDTSNKTIQIRSRSPSRSKLRTSRNQTPFSRKAISNPFLIFLQEFRQNYPGMLSKEISKLAGERWRQMTTEQKKPYIESAEKIRKRNKDQTGKDPRKKSDRDTESRNKKKERRSRTETDSDSTSVSSVAAETATSDDVSE